MSDDAEALIHQLSTKVLEKGLKSAEEVEKTYESEIIKFIFLQSLSTKEKVTDVSGGGIGMDAVKAEIESIGGTISVFSKVGKGTQFVILLPIFNKP